MTWSGVKGNLDNDVVDMPFLNVLVDVCKCTDLTKQILKLQQKEKITKTMARFAIEVQFNSIIEPTWSGEWGSTACIQGRQSKERRTFRQPTFRNIHFEPVSRE